MSELNSRPGLSTALKVSGNRTTYEPLQMTDESVFDLARHYYTMDEISALFGVSNNTLLALHGDAFRAGKHSAMQKPRMLLNKIFDDFAGGEFPLNLARPDVPTHNLLKAIELHAKKYEGLGSTQTIVTKTELPSASEIKFDPFTKPTEGESAD